MLHSPVSYDGLRQPRMEVDFDPRPILETLARHRVDFVLAGGLAGVVLGSAFQTGDVDVVYDRSSGNLERLAIALRELGATLRGARKDVPFLLDAKSLAAGANFTFDTRYGSLDILGDPAGAPRYETLRANSERLDVGGIAVAVSSIDDLIAMKEAAGRPRDKLMVSEYKLLADEIRRREAEGIS
jgi:hypothetical protein